MPWGAWLEVLAGRKGAQAGVPVPPEEMPSTCEKRDRGYRVEWRKIMGAGRTGRRRIGMKTCTHLDQIRNVKPGTPNGCEECLKMGDTWVHLRLCLECGHVGCCDSSKNKHATKHFHRTKHPIMKSFEPGENWGWCYIDEVELDSSSMAAKA